jgi:hypothetical protein
MKNKSKTGRVAALLLVLCMISMVMLGGTFAKYTDTFSGKDTALIARWNITPTELNFGKNADYNETLDLFNHAKTQHILPYSVAEAAYILAPGVNDSFTMDFTNNSDVAAKIEFTIDNTGSSVDLNKLNMEYSLTAEDGTTALTYVDKGDTDGDANTTETLSVDTAFGSLATLQTNLNKYMKYVDIDGNKTALVTWKWAYYTSDSEDIDDTAVGSASQEAALTGTRSPYVVRIKATATQIEPQ